MTIFVWNRKEAEFDYEKERKKNYKKIKNKIGT
jgi:hypothetical protein